jgi:hypothetical protein
MQWCYLVYREGECNDAAVLWRSRDACKDSGCAIRMSCWSMWSGKVLVLNRY